MPHIQSLNGATRGYLFHMATTATNNSSNSTTANTPANSAQDSMGVYLRNSEANRSTTSQKELDVLWSEQQGQQSGSIVRHIKDEHHPLLTFVAGLLTGVVLTGLFFWVFNSRPQTPVLDAVTDDNVAIVETQAGEEARAVRTPSESDSNNRSTTEKTLTTSKTTQEDSQAGTAESAVGKNVKGSVYQVKSGDTLGGIANKFYGSSSPAYVQRIVEANDMKSQHQLSLGQEIVIPPKSY
jgi:nucleoid-associated protein YgaU